MICGVASGGLNSKVKTTDEILGMLDMVDSCIGHFTSSHVYKTMTLKIATEKQVFMTK